MATRLFLRDFGSDFSARLGFGSPYVSLVGGNENITVRRLITEQGTQALSSPVANTVAGPTAGIEIRQSGQAILVFVTPPLSAGATISGSVTFNIWAHESAMNANAAINARLMKVSNVGVMTEVHKTIRTTELGTSSSAQNWNETPSSFSLARGDRLLLILFADDAGTMGSGFTVNAIIAGPAGSAGDTYIELTENLTFDDTDPAGTTIYPTDTASDVATAAVDREAWTARGAGVQTDVTNTAAAPASPIQVTDTAGGSVVDWFTKPLAAMTLAGPVYVNQRAIESNSLANAGMGCEIARVDGDGSNPVVWGSALVWEELGTSESARQFFVAGPDLAISDGQRLRIRFFIDDAYSENTATLNSMTSGRTATLFYAGTTGGASGDTFLTFSQTLVEFVGSKNVSAQAQAVIVAGQVRNGYSQAQAKIKRTYNNFAQAQARVKKTYNSFAQSQARIKNTYRGYAQTQARIKITLNSFAQSQAQILQTYNSFAQVQGRILTTYNAFAQVQAQIKRIYYEFAQAQATIAVLLASDNFQRTVSSGWGTSTPNPNIIWVDRDTITPGFIESGSVNGSYAITPSGIIQTRKKGYPLLQRGMIQFDFWVPSNTSSGGDYNIDSLKGGTQVLAVGGGDWNLRDVFDAAFNFVFVPDASSWYTVKFTTGINGDTIWAKVWKTGTQEPDWQTSGVKASNTSPRYFSIESFNSEEARIDNIFFWTFDNIYIITPQYPSAQAQAQIIAFNINRFAQAQAEIVTAGVVTLDAYSQSQAQIKQIYQGYSQAQAQILQVYNQCAQSQATILTSVVRCANAQGRIYISQKLYPIQDITTSTDIVGVVV